MGIVLPVRQVFNHSTAIVDGSGRWIMDCLNDEVAEATVNAINCIEWKGRIREIIGRLGGAPASALIQIQELAKG